MTSHYPRFLSLPTWIAVLVMPLLIAPATAQTTPLVSSGGGKMYWIDWGTDKIHRADLDGSNVEDLITTGLRWPSGIALDVGGGKMYWTEDGTNKIQRASLDGSQVEDLVTAGALLHK